MKKYNYIIIILMLLVCGAMPTKALAQSVPVSTDDEDKETSSYILNVAPLDQHNSHSQYNDYNCFIAAMYMALDFFGEDIVYDELIPLVRGNDKNGLSTNSDFVFGVTHGRLLAEGKYTTHLANIIEEELMEDHPVVVAIRNMSLLAENWNSTAGHAVLVYGIYNGRIFYIDPFNGERYSMSAQAFVEASTYPSGSFAIIFKDLD